jgi:lipoate-protein ligase A
MKWLFNWNREDNMRNIPEEIEKLFAKLIKKDFLKAIVVFDEEGIIIYSINRSSLFLDKDVQMLFNLFRNTEKIISESIRNDRVVLFKNLLHYRVSLINVKFGVFRLWFVKSQNYYLVAITDESEKSINMEEFEDLLCEKLKELEELKIIELYSRG